MAGPCLAQIERHGNTSFLHGLGIVVAESHDRGLPSEKRWVRIAATLTATLDRGNLLVVIGAYGHAAGEGSHDCGRYTALAPDSDQRRGRVDAVLNIVSGADAVAAPIVARFGQQVDLVHHHIRRGGNETWGNDVVLRVDDARAFRDAHRLPNRNNVAILHYEGTGRN